MSNLKKYREEVGLTQAQLAQTIGRTQGAVAHYEAGRRQPGLHECRLMLSALRSCGATCSLDELFPVSVSSSEVA